MVAKANMATMHHFSSAFKMEDEYFEILVKGANFSKRTRRLLIDSEIR